MTKHIALAAMLVSGTGAMAADTEFKWDAESRTRFFSSTGYTRQGAGLAGGSALNSATETRDGVARQRTSLGLNFKKGDSLSGRVRLLHTMQWGAATGQTSPAQPSGTIENTPYIQEAWLAWNFAENLTAKWGRSAMMTVADGTVVSTNEWLENPYASENVTLVGDYSFARVGFMAVKATELNGGGAGGAIVEPLSVDPETVFYGVSFDIKNLPDFLKSVNIHAIQQNTDQTTLAGAGLGLTRYGLTVAGDTMGIDYRLTYAMHTGKLNSSATTGTDRKGSMIDGGIGYTLSDMKNLRIGVKYHMDTGADQDAANGSETYQPFYYERHANAGRMDLIGWGNLTNIEVELGMDLMENSRVGLTYNMFSRTSDKDTAYSEVFRPTAAGSGLGALTTDGTAANTAKDIGSEIDLWLTHKYDNGLELTARYGMFTAGDYLKKSFGNTNDNKGATQAMLEARATF